MIRYSLLTFLIAGLSIYALKDWYRSLCALIVLMAIYRHQSMPSAMFGVTGLNPWNILFIFVLFGCFLARRREGITWEMPGHLNKLMILYFTILLIGLIRFNIQPDSIVMLYELKMSAPSGMGLYIEVFINGFKFLVPAFLLFLGCNSKERFLWAYFSLALMYVVLGLLVIKVMPLGQIADSEVLERASHRVLGRDLGIFRTNLAPMLAGGFWMIVALQSYFGRKYRLLIPFCAAIVLLGLLLTAGRAGYLACGVMGVVFMYVRWRKYLLWAPIVFAAMVILLPSVAGRIGIGDSAPQIESKTECRSAKHDNAAGAACRFQQEQSEESYRASELSAGRSIMWPPVVEKILDRPWVGWGYNGVISSRASMEFKEIAGWSYLHPHSAYLQLFIDNGIILALPIILFYFFVVRYAWSLYRFHDKQSIEVLAGTAGLSLVGTFLLACLTGQSFYPEERSFGMWCVLMLMLRVFVEHQKLRNPKVSWRSGNKAPEKVDLDVMDGIWQAQPVSDSGHHIFTKWKK